MELKGTGKGQELFDDLVDPPDFFQDEFGEGEKFLSF